MTETQNQIENNFILARAQEHKLILETVGEMEACLKFNSADEMIQQLRQLVEPFKEKLTMHQQLEEQVIFSAALETVPADTTISTILQLQKDHGYFEATLDSIIYNLWNLEENNQNRQMIEHEIKKLLSQLKKHSLLEIKNLFPVLSKNPKCSQLIHHFAENIEF
ncbi:MAG: hemerythrin domain-containing protein [Candidatus Rifleibacteriota bacterium]